ncbi:glutathione S-transferase [Bradyrhizobium japonicum]|uniref:glutathione S-transferase n=1 Tax=Bradyrhizobium TaxID=374 RepID=UPI0004B0C3EF
MSIIVHHLEDSRSLRVLWLLEELGLKYQVKYYQRERRTMLAPASLRHIHPLGKSPVIQDIDGGVERTVAETGAIIEYLVEKAGGAFGAPPAREDALMYRYYLHYAEGSLMPVLFTRLVLSRVPIFWQCRDPQIPAADQCPSRVCGKRAFQTGMVCR